VGIFEQGWDEIWVWGGGCNNVCYADHVCLIHDGRLKIFMSYDCMEWYEKGLTGL